MQFYYGGQNVLRALDEAEFWKHQEAEHAGLIPLVTSNLEPQYNQKLIQFGIDLNHMHAEAVKYTTSVTRSKGILTRERKIKMMNFIKSCIDQSGNFVELMEDMLQNSHAVQSSQPSQTVIRHMIRESQYFIGIDQLILS